MSKKLLNKLTKRIQNEYSFNASEEDNIYSIKKYFSTGTYILDGIISGDIYKGIPFGKRVQYAGPSSTGKSYLAAFSIKRFLDTYKDSFCVFFESEGSTVIEMLKALNVDLDRVQIFPVGTVEDLRIQTTQMLDTLKEERNKGEEFKCICIVDSLGNMGTLKEYEDAKDGKTTTDMTRAKIIKSWGRITALNFSLLQIPLIVVNHTYSSQSMYGGDVVSGGTGPEYISDVVLVIKKSKDKDSQKKRIGSKLKIKVKKSRFTTEDIDCELLLSFKNGLYKYSDIIEKSYSLGVLKKSGNNFLFPDGSEHEMKVVRDMKGQKKFITTDLLDKLNEKIKETWKFQNQLEDYRNDEIMEEKKEETKRQDSSKNTRTKK